jgi:membrane-bound serine protease (ClpP class)
MNVDFLLDPNVAYLILVLTSMATIMAVLTPGTGVIELFALFLWLISAYIIYSIPINIWALGLLLLGFVLFLLSLRRIKNLIVLGLSIAAVVIGSAFLFDQPGWQPAVNPFLVLFVSIVVSGFTWVVARKVLDADSMVPVHDLEGLIGASGVAKTAVSEEGSVQVGGELWSAKSDQVIPEGSPVRVVGREGFDLKVEQV